MAKNMGHNQEKDKDVDSMAGLCCIQKQAVYQQLYSIQSILHSWQITNVCSCQRFSQLINLFLDHVIICHLLIGVKALNVNF